MTFATITHEERDELENLCAWLSTQKSDVFKNPFTILEAALNQFPADPTPAIEPANQPGSKAWY